MSARRCCRSLCQRPDSLRAARHDRRNGYLCVMRVAARQPEDMGTALLVADGVELYVPALSGDANTMS